MCPVDFQTLQSTMEGGDVTLPAPEQQDRDLEN